MIRFENYDYREIYIDPDDVSAVLPAEFSARNRTIIVLKSGEKIVVTGDSYGVGQKIDGAKTKGGE